MTITFSKENIKFTLPKKSKLKLWIENTIKSEKKIGLAVCYTFVSDEALLKMNKEYLNHNTYTDIITFDYSEQKKITGDIFISIDRVKENAKKFKVKFEDELNRVIIHGVLHLCGYKDKTKTDALTMRKKENKYLLIFKNL